MTRELVFHLGDHKTGTTSIQDTLRRKNWVGAVPSVSFVTSGFQHSDIAKAVTHGGLTVRRQHDLVDWAARVRTEPADIAVISSEAFESADPELLRAALQDLAPDLAAGVRLIAYVRPHADRVLSSYAERVKLGIYTGNLTEFVDQLNANNRFHYLGRFTRWRSVFGTRFELRPMIRSLLHEQCVVRDFLSFAFNSRDFTLKSNPDANESLSVEDLAILLELHRCLGDSARKNKSAQSIGRNYALLLATMPQQTATKLALSAATYAKVRQLFAADAEALDHSFFSGSPMSDALQAAAHRTVAETQSVRAEDHYPPDEVRMMRSLAGLVAQMASYAPDAWVQHFTQLRLGTAPPEGAGDPARSKPAKAKTAQHRPADQRKKTAHRS